MGSSGRTLTPCWQRPAVFLLLDACPQAFCPTQRGRCARLPGFPPKPSNKHSAVGPSSMFHPSALVMCRTGRRAQTVDLHSTSRRLSAGRRATRPRPPAESERKASDAGGRLVVLVHSVEQVIGAAAPEQNCRRKN